jgi:hypothetical protein
MFERVRDIYARQVICCEPGPIRSSSGAGGGRSSDGRSSRIALALPAITSRHPPVLSPSALWLANQFV